MRTLIKGGTVVSADRSVHMDVLVEGETIAALYAPGVRRGVTADRDRIDATGKYVIPGGIDVHTHMEMPFGGTFSSDTFETGTRAAAWGGITTIVDFIVQRTGEVVQEALAAWHTKAGGHCAIDYGFHMILGGVDEDALKAMDQLVDRRGHHQLQDVHGVPGGVLLRRRADPAGDAEGVEQRRARS